MPGRPSSIRTRSSTAGVWISRAEVAETPFVAFGSRKKAEQVAGRLVVGRVPGLNADAHKAGQDQLFDSWRFHAFFTTSSLEIVAADKTHRQHAIIEQVHADAKNSALAHLPSGVFAANAAWLVLAVMAFNLTRAAANLAGALHGKATTGTVQRQLVHVPARVACSARRLVLHLPTGWLWQHAWTELFTRSCGPPERDALTTSAQPPPTGQENPMSRSGEHPRSEPTSSELHQTISQLHGRRWIEA